MSITKALTIIFAILGLLSLVNCSEPSQPVQTVSTAKLKNPTEPYQYQLNGVTINNDYNWLAVPSGEQTQASLDRITSWQQKQLQLSQNYFTDLKKSTHSPVANYYFSQYDSGHYYSLMQQNQLWYISDYNSISAEISNIALDSSAFKRLTALAISAGGRYAAYQAELINSSPNPQFRWYFYDLANQKPLPRQMPITDGPSSLQWLGEQKLLYTSNRAAFWGYLYQQPRFDKEVFKLSDELIGKVSQLTAVVTDDREYLLINAYLTANQQNKIWLKILSDPEQKLRNLITDVKAQFTFIGNHKNQFHFQTNLAAPRQRIIAVDIKNPSRRFWKEIIKQQQGVLLATKLAANQLLLNYYENTQTKLFTAKLNGTKLQVIGKPLFSDLTFSPSHLSLESSHSQANIVNASSLGKSSQPYLIEPEKLAPIFQPPANPTEKFDLFTSELSREVAFFRSQDGSRIPISLIYNSKRKKISKNGQNPTLLVSNDGFGANFNNQYRQSFANFIKAGGLIALVHARGGGDYGSSWHKNGSGRKKGKAVEDLSAAIDWLFDKNYTNKGKLAAYANQANSPLFSHLINQSEQSFSAIIFEEGVFNLIQAEQLKTLEWQQEYAFKNDKKTTQQLLDFSAFHQITTKDYPAILLLQNQPSLNSWQYLAKLQNHQMTAKPILFVQTSNDGALELPAPEDFIQYFLKQELDF